MLDTKVVQVTGRGTNVNFVIDDSASIDEVALGLHEHLKQHRSLYSRGSITVNVGKRLLEREELTRIKEILEKESGVTVSRFWCPPHLLEEALSQSIGFGVSVSPSETPVNDDNTRARETRKASYVEPSDDSGLEQWVAYVLDRPPGEKKPEAGSITPAEPAVVDEMVPQEAPAPETAAEETESTHEDAGPPPLARGESEGGETTRPNLPLSRGGTSQTPSQGLEEQQKPEVTDLVQGPSPAPEPAIPATPASAQPVAEQSIAVPRPDQPRPAEPRRESAGLYRNNETLLIKTTCRSGEVIRYPGDVVVMADVNPGAEVIADGDILVFGSLRGLAHAGASGDIQGTIIALSLETHRLQIGPYTGVAPKSNKRSKSNKSDPRIAFVRRRSVYVAPYAGRFAGYSGGTLYDG
jgi:septum site-determining protein MinC